MELPHVVIEAINLGWSVIPVDETKRPPLLGFLNKKGEPARLAWKPCQEKRASIEQINQWQERFNPSGWAVVTGAISNLIILDGDGEAGRETFRKLSINPHRQTGSGSWHCDFEYPGWHVPTLNAKSKKELGERWPGLDIRGDGGYAVFCGKNTSGEYIWLRTPGELDSLDTLPNDLRSFLSLLNPPEVTMKRTIADVALEKALSEAHAGRDDACFRLAKQLHDNNYSQSEAESICMEFARLVPTHNTKGKHEPFTESDARAKVTSAYSYAKRDPWSSTTNYSPGQDHSSNGNGHVSPNRDEELNRFDADDAGNGDAMKHLFGQVFVYNEAVGWMRYTGTHWQADEGHAKLLKSAIETLRRRRHAAVEADRENIIKVTASNTQRINGAIACFKTHVVRSIDTFDAEEHLLNCKNGVVNLKTGDLTPHSNDQFFTYCVPIEYKVSDYAEWIDYLHGVVGGGDEMINYLQLALGYSLTGSTREECLFYVYGPSRSGKGTVAEILLRLLPRPLSTMVDFNSFTAKREGDVSNFDLAELKPSRVVFASESQRNQSLNPAKIKQLTGGDLVRASFKHKNFFTYRPQFKVWMLSNWPVNGDPEDDALWGRVRVIPFPNSYLGKEDKGKKERLKSDEVLTSILYWAVQGAIKWYALGSSGLQTPDYVDKITKSQRDAQDFVKQWMTECCQDAKGDEKAWTPNEVVIASYTKWCETNNVTPKKAKSLSQSLQMKGYQTGVLKRFGSKVQKGVSGFRIPVSLWQANGNQSGSVTDVTDVTGGNSKSDDPLHQPVEPSEVPSVTDVTDVTDEKANSENPYHKADFTDSPVTSVTEDQSVTNSQEVPQNQALDDAAIPDNFTFKDTECTECACGLTRHLDGNQVCVRCYPPKGYFAYSHLVDEMYPKKQHKVEFGKAG